VNGSEEVSIDTEAEVESAQSFVDEGEEDEEVDIDDPSKFDIPSTELQSTTIPNNSGDDDDWGTDDEGEPEELNENEFIAADSDAASISEESYVNTYLANLQERLKGKKPDEYLNGTFWVHPRNPYFMLEKSNKDPCDLYTPRVFLWFPHHLVKNLKCPVCEVNISVKGFNKKPRARRIIDVNDCFYLMTMRYKCRNKDKTHTFDGCNPALVRQLPLNLQAEFPAVLTHRSGLSKVLCKLMRPLFQHGIGPHRMAKVLRVMHTEKYDELQLQYYATLDSETENLSILSMLQPKNYPEFSKFGDKMKYNGYVPSAKYISYAYSSLIAKVRPFMDQLMSFIDGTVLKGDHSFKIIDHLAKINGVSTFSCLYTVLNEHEDIRLQVLAQSKKMEHLAPQFLQMMDTYKKLNMKDPELFYTDNVIGDQGFLKQVIPSLSKGVVSIPKIGNRPERDDPFLSLPTISLPETTSIVVATSAADINGACVEVFGNTDEYCTEIHVGFDCEWIMSTSGISLIQICHQNKIVLFRVHAFNTNTFPCELSKVLRCPKVVKLGRNIKADCTRIERVFGIATASYVDLGPFCYCRNLVESSRPRLDILCGEVLSLKLPKISLIRCGDWEKDVLTFEQINYAALDAWVALMIYKKADEHPAVNEKVTKDTARGTFVAIYNRTSARVMPSAYGFIEDDGGSSHSHIKNTRVVRVDNVQVLSMLLESHQQKENLEARTLSDMGEPPFLLRVSTHCLGTASRVLYDQRNQKQHLEAISGATVSGVNLPNANQSQQIPSRILKDAFHVMQMIRVSLKHGMAKEFSRRFRDAMFVVDLEDKRAVSQYLDSIGTDWESYMVKNPDFILERVSRYIPPPEELFNSVSLLFDYYGPAKCILSGKPLFNEDAWSASKHVLEEIRLGHVSDIANGPVLYTEKGYDKNGLMKYRCSRGTSSVEGSVHMNIIRKFASYNAGPRLADMVLADYRLYHNTDVGSRNRYGKVHKGHYSPWLYQSINTIRIKLGHAPIDSYFTNRLGSTFEYEQTNETFGITALPNEIMREYHILPDSNLPMCQTFSKEKLLELSLLPVVKFDIIGCSVKEFVYNFLAKCQKTKLAVTAVYTDEEIKLYGEFMSNNEKRDMIGLGTEKSAPNFTCFAKLWSSYCKEGSNIYYKTPRHLESYYNILDDRQKYYDTVMLNISTVRKVRSALTSDSRFTISIPAQVQQTAEQAIGRMSHIEIATPSPPEHQQLQQHLTPLRVLLPAPVISTSFLPQVNSPRAQRTCAVCKTVGCKGT
ncbi:hypothetical protein INT47_009991, partial [Mucor saturninus]